MTDAGDFFTDRKCVLTTERTKNTEDRWGCLWNKRAGGSPCSPHYYGENLCFLAASGFPQLKRFPVGKCFPRINQGEHQRSGLTTEATNATENHQQVFSKGNLPIPSVFSVHSAVKALSQFANVFRIGCGCAALGSPWSDCLLVNHGGHGGTGLAVLVNVPARANHSRQLWCQAAVTIAFEQTIYNLLTVTW